MNLTLSQCYTHHTHNNQLNSDMMCVIYSAGGRILSLIKKYRWKLVLPRVPSVAVLSALMWMLAGLNLCFAGTDVAEQTL